MPVVSDRGALDEEDRLKLETWLKVMRLLRHYRDLARNPLYQIKPGILGSSQETLAVRERKLKAALDLDRHIDEIWAERLGPHWQSIMDPND